MDLDVALLSRIQFGFTVGFHYLFPPLTIGTGWLIAIMETLFHKTGDKLYEQMARFWTKLFAVTFAMGVATGIVMEFEFGTNWAVYSKFVGDVFGSALAAEGIFAFFLESGFLAVLVFGWDRVSPKVHLFSTWMVALGATFSAVWIVVANSWQQTPAGYHIVGEGAAARAEITDFWAMVFNPSSMHRLNHVLFGALILGSFFVMSISAWYLLKNRHIAFAKRSFTVALVVGFLACWCELVSGHFQADKLLYTQPEKLAAFEGHFETGEGGAPLYVAGWADEEAKKTHGFAIPGGLSFLLHWNFTEPVPGLDQFPESDWPPVNFSFQTYHMMVAMGMTMIGLTTLAMFLLLTKRLFDQRWLLWVFVFAVLAPYVANQSGWIAAEVGRQPWIVWKLLRTEDAVSTSIDAGQVVGSLIMFASIYLLLFMVWIFVLNSKIQKGPEASDAGGDNMGAGFMAAAETLADPSGKSLSGTRDAE